MRNSLAWLPLVVLLCGGPLSSIADEPPLAVASDVLDGERYRVLVSTDVGGTDPDDFQSLVHLFVYADGLDLEGLIASPYGAGRAADILRVIDAYDEDLPQLQRYSASYPTAAALRRITKQGATRRAPYAGIRQPTAGSRWITTCGRRDDSRPLYVLVWGGLEDVAQALHDAPDILPKLRVYWIGGPNKKWSPDAYQYIVQHHPTLWMIESNATYRGWFTGGNQQGPWGNERFVRDFVQGRGALGTLFVQQKADIKMGDTPSLAWLLRGNANDPTAPSWGGRYVRAWPRPHRQLKRMPTEDDRVEIFSIVEFVLRVPDRASDLEAFLIVENQRLSGHVAQDGTLRFRFCPKAAKRYDFTVESNRNSLDGLKGSLIAELPPADQSRRPAASLPHWWTDHPQANLAEGSHHGAKTVSRWREDFLADFARRMDRLRTAAQ